MQYSTQASYLDKTLHRQRVMNELKQVGVTRYGLMKMESRYLPEVIHENEHIQAVAYGHSNEGSVMLIATDFRVIFLDIKPLFVNADEITYDVVSGVKHSQTGFGSTVTLHTRVKDFQIRTINNKSVKRFVNFIEQRCLEQNQQRRYPL